MDRLLLRDVPTVKDCKSQTVQLYFCGIQPIDFSVVFLTFRAVSGAAIRQDVDLPRFPPRPTVQSAILARKVVIFKPSHLLRDRVR